MTYTHLRFRNHNGHRFPLVVRPPNFFSITCLMASFSKVRLATMRLSLAFSSSNSFIFLTSLTSIPPYLACRVGKDISVRTSHRTGLEPLGSSGSSYLVSQLAQCLNTRRWFVAPIPMCKQCRIYSCLFTQPI